MVVSHPLAVADGVVNRGNVPTDEFNSRYVCSHMLTVTAGSQVWLTCNEGGVSCSHGEQNRNGFTHVVECRHDPYHQTARGRAGVGPRAYNGTGVKYYTFDVNFCMKVTAGQVLSPEQRDHFFHFIEWVADALKTPGTKMCVHCALAAWVNQTASLLQYGPAFTCLNNRSNASSSDTWKTSN